MTVKVTHDSEGQFNDDALNLPCLEPWDNMCVETLSSRRQIFRKDHSLQAALFWEVHAARHTRNLENRKQKDAFIIKEKLVQECMKRT